MTTNQVEEIEHTADWAIHVRAASLGELFEHAAKGMFKLIGHAQNSAVGSILPITLQAADIETLLVSWLEELLYLLDTENLIPCKYQVQILSETQLLANVEFLPVEERWKEIKAVTYHELDVRQTTAGYEVTIVFDV